MMNKDQSIEWLQCWTEEYRSKEKDMGDLLEEVEHEGKLGQGFASMDHLEEMDIGDGHRRWKCATTDVRECQFDQGTKR
jgi:hypothetical protein